eukprot:2732118-Alexandrium_andersonii.AAC.1
MEAAGPALAHDVADLTAGPLRIVFGQRQEWFVKVERGALVTVAGAGESATAPMPGAAWLRIVGPSARRGIASWHATCTATLTVQGA